ncbi:MAG: hypothetical protein AB1426_04200 [Bacillota bacterium]
MGKEAKNLDAAFLEKVRPVLRELGFASERDALKEQALLLLLHKINRYEAECAFFAKKYGMSFEEFVKHLEASGKEDFEKEDDLLDWRFAAETLAELKRQLQEIERA